MIEQLRLKPTVLILIIVLGLLAACGGSDVSAPADPTAAQAPESQNERLSRAIDAGLVDCFDPLHDSDGSGGFFEFCDKARAADAVGQLDCLDPSYQPDDSDCDQWRVDESSVPPYYFDLSTETATVDPGSAPTEPPADVVPPPDAIMVLEWIEFGGCTPIDRCGHYRVYLDGTVEAARANGEVLARSTLDEDLLAPVVRVSEVRPELIDLLPPGPCNAAVDGISQQIWVPLVDLRLDTCEVDISVDISPFITGVRELGQAAIAATPIDWDAANGD